MIKPTKHMNLNNSIIKITANILIILKKHKIIEYNELLDKLELIYGKDVRYNFIYCLNLLYLFNKLKYYPKSDLFELVE